jgi:hypothetical protein
MKNRKREICTSGTVRDEDGNILIYSANDRGDRGNVGIIRSQLRASILPDYKIYDPPTASTLPELEDVPAQSRGGDRCD